MDTSSIVVSLTEARRLIATRQDGTPSSKENEPLDAAQMARILCREVAGWPARDSQWIALDTLAKQSALSGEELLVGAMYAHVRGWLYATYGVVITDDGRAVAATIAAPLRSR